MSILERFGLVVVFTTGLLLTALLGYAIYDYASVVRPAAVRLNETIMKTNDGKELNRIDVYDAVTKAVIDSMAKESNVPSTAAKP